MCSDKDSKLNLFKDYPQDYCAEMKDVPASPIGSTSGANIVNIGMWIKVSLKFEIKVLQPNWKQFLLSWQNLKWQRYTVRPQAMQPQSPR